MMDFEEIKKIWGEKSTHDYIFIQKTIDQLKLTPEAAILDIGTGWGVMAINLALRGFHVVTGEPDVWQKTHADHNPNAGQHQREDWKQIAERFDVADKIKYQTFNAESLPFSTEAFDGIFLYNTLHHVSDKAKVINECARVLNPGGVVCIFEMNESGHVYFRKTHDHGHHVINPLEFVDKSRFHEHMAEGPFTTAYTLIKK